MQPNDIPAGWVPEDVYLLFLYELRGRAGEDKAINDAILNGTIKPSKVSRKTQLERCQWISDRHLLWGDDCPCLNLDYFSFSFLALEFDKGKAVALVEYKHREESPMNSWAKAALIDLAQRARVPAFEVRYDPEEVKFCIDVLYQGGQP